MTTSSSKPSSKTVAPLSWMTTPATTTVVGGKAAPGGRNTTDVVYQEVRLYIEGVQVPFEAISVSQAMGQLPSAEIQVPSQSGLMDICRYYQPKVHVFYEDANTGGFRLLFWGHIVAVSYHHSRSGSGRSTINFRCEHKNALLRQVTLDYCGYINPGDPSASDPQSAVPMEAINSKQSIVEALKGISGVQEEAKDLLSSTNRSVDAADTTKLPKDLSELKGRFRGMTAVGANLWNQVKKSVYRKPKLNTVMSGMLIPLVEESLAYFKRMSGHPYVDELIEASRQQYCPGQSSTANIIVPPSLRLHITTAVQAQLSVEIINSKIAYSGEMTDFTSLLENFYYSIGYEVLTLSSPCEVPADPNVILPDGKDANVEKMAVETIIKPQLPFYYAPACNVLYPRLYHTLSVTQDESSIPTRVTATHDSMPGGLGNMGTNFRGPHTIREAVAYASSLPGSGEKVSSPSLQSTFGLSHNAPGKYEQGRGFKHFKIGLPWWLQVVTKDLGDNAGGKDMAVWPDKGTDQYESLLALTSAWRTRTGYDIVENDDGRTAVRNKSKDMLNPYDRASGIYPYQAMLFTSVDYEFTKSLVSSRSGSVEAVFNPYIIPGYPMDVLDDSPNNPSFHAVCSSVTHSITSRSISTTIGMVAVMTYAELSNYYTPGSQPWLQTALGMIAVDMSNADPERDEYGSTEWVKMQNAGTIVNNAKAKNIADLYYAATLGVRAADPTDLMDWVTGQPVPQQRKDGGTVPGNNVRVSSPNGGDSNDFNTTVGNLRLVTRPIESMEAIKKKFSYAFIDINPINYNTSTVSVQNYRLGSKDPSKPDPGSYLEPGASLFLDYEETPSFIKSIRDREVVGALGPVSGPPVTPDPTYGDAVSRRYGSKY